MAKGLVEFWWWPLRAADLTIGTYETLWHTSAVLAARMPIIGAAMIWPLGADHRELELMVTEKIDAFGKSSRRLQDGQRRIRRGAEANARDARRLLLGNVLGISDWSAIVIRNLALLSTFATLPGEVLAPVRERVAGNARRLNR